jgi:hypothetical protein
VFYNLQSLHQAVLLAIDTNIKKALELSISIISVDKVSKLQSDKASVVQQSKKPLKTSETTNNNTSNQNESYNQTKVALMEIAHSWALSVFELAMQVLVLQKVLSKKEDPISHKRFADILATSIPSSVSANNVVYDKNGRSITTNLHLSKNDLVALFWERLALSLHDVFTTKLKQNPNALILLYPHLTKFGSEANDSLEVSILY